VRVEHPLAQRWGFQLTARPVNDETKMAGTFSTTELIRVACDDGSAEGRVAPAEGCGGALEFASHNANSNRIGSAGVAEFEVEWIPPINEVGDVMLYAAGNAADNSANNVGDRIYTSSLRIQSDGACNLTTRPSDMRVVNGASFQPNLLSINSMFTIFGRNFQVAGRTRTAGPGDIFANRYRPELGCVAVEVNNQRVPVTYVQFDQINAQLPTISDTGPVQVRVILNPGRPNELRSDVAMAQLQNYSPAFFTFGASGSIAARFPNTANIVANPSVVAGARPARPGEIVELYGTGFGVTNPVWQSGELSGGLARLRDQYTITIGGVALAPEDILYAGLAPGSISGLYQFNVRIAAAAPNGDLPVVVRIGGVESPRATIPVQR
jgi:uncharacterized protein (TIGR03437 family)